MSANKRRRAILEALCERRFDTEVNLAFEFGVSKRTIATDILELSCEYPIYTKTGGIGGGGVYVEEWYRLDCKFFTDKQLELAERILPYLEGEDWETMKAMIHTFAPGKRRWRERKK